MEGISVSEINDTNPNNVAESFCVPDNEKANNERNVEGDERSNATIGKRKSVKKAVVFLLAAGSASLLGGELLANASLSNGPTVSDVSCAKNESSLVCSFAVKEAKSLSVLFFVRQGGDPLYGETLRESGTYERTIPLLSKEELYITLSSTDGVGEEKVLFETYL